MKNLTSLALVMLFAFVFASCSKNESQRLRTEKELDVYIYHQSLTSWGAKSNTQPVLGGQYNIGGAADHSFNQPTVNYSAADTLFFNFQVYRNSVGMADVNVSLINNGTTFVSKSLAAANTSSFVLFDGYAAQTDRSKWNVMRFLSKDFYWPNRVNDYIVVGLPLTGGAGKTYDLVITANVDGMNKTQTVKNAITVQ